MCVSPGSGGSVLSQHFVLPSDVMAEMAAEEAADQLWDDATIDADIAQVIKNRIAPKSRTTYTDYTVRFMIFLFDQRERLPNLIRYDFLDILYAEHLRATRCGESHQSRSHEERAEIYLQSHQGCTWINQWE